jgi:hypothetical protein
LCVCVCVCVCVCIGGRGWFKSLGEELTQKPREDPVAFNNGVCTGC